MRRLISPPDCICEWDLMLVLEKLSKTYAGARRRSVLHGVDLTLASGEYLAVMGDPASASPRCST